MRAQPGDPLERSRGRDGRRGPTQRHSFTQRRGPAARLVGRAAGPCDRASAVVDGDDVGVLLEPGVDGLGLAALAVLVHDEVLEGAVLLVVQADAADEVGGLAAALREAGGGEEIGRASCRERVWIPV